MESIRVALVQMKSKVGDTAGNLATMRAFMEQAAVRGTQLVCFPEASLTGYSSKFASSIALLPDSPEVFEVFDLADSLGIAVCFGLFERAGDANGHGNAHDDMQDTSKLFIAQPLHVCGKTLWHRKTHLGSKEQETVTPGQTLETIEVFGVRVGVEICWETHFPELAGIQRGQGAELLLMPFASGASGTNRRDSWMKYLPARALDNGLYVLACNALLDPVSTTSPTALGGGLIAIDPSGAVIAEHFEPSGHMLVCDLTGALPREASRQTLEPTGSAMSSQSYFDRRRPELFGKYHSLDKRV